jgi:hypothetical protein
MSDMHDSTPAKPGTHRIARVRAGAVMAMVTTVTLLVGAGCSKSADKPDGNQVAASGTAPTAPASDATTSTPDAGSDDVVSFDTLSTIKLPTPKGAPAGGKWQVAPVPTSEDGDLIANFIIGADQYWVGMTILDCNRPAIKASAGKPITNDLGNFKSCLATTAPGKLKGYALFNDAETERAVKVGHLAVIVNPGLAGQGKVKPADLEALLGGFDLDAIAKL